MVLIATQGAAMTSALRRSLRARAHALVPVVMISEAGPTPAVMHEIDVSLKAHELIKVRANNNERDVRERWLKHICMDLAALPVQHIGKVLVIYREQRDKRAASATPATARPKRLLKRAYQEHGKR